MIQRQRGGRRGALVALFLFLTLAPISGLARGQKTEREEFEQVDPYTKGERAALDKAGYVALGPFRVCEKHTSAEMVETLGGGSIIFIETAHFRIASTLESYKPVGDTVEKELNAREFAELKKKFPKLKVPTKIDQWLRAHLYAHRLESLYADFWKRFALTDEDFVSLEAKAKAGQFMGVGPYLGQKDKFVVFLSNTRSALGRYLRTYVGVEDEYSYRAKFADCYFYGTNFEALKDNGRDLDIALYTTVAGAVVQNFLDGFRDSNQAAPEWVRYGLAHWYARRIDARWNQWNAGGASNPDDDKKWFWEPRVLGLVKNEAALTWDEMSAWPNYDAIKAGDHMLAWSRVDWLLATRAADARAFLFGISNQVPPGTGPERSKAILYNEQKAYESIWKQKPADLDKAWRAWVTKEYPKREPPQ